jgi:hypothetical protein
VAIGCSGTARHLADLRPLHRLAYCGVAGAYWLLTDIPYIWKPFVIIDLVMGILFVFAFQALGKPATQLAT